MEIIEAFSEAIQIILLLALVSLGAVLFSAEETIKQILWIVIAVPLLMLPIYLIFSSLGLSQ